MVLKLREKHAQSVQDAGDAGEGGVVLAGKQLRVAPMQRGEHLGHQAQPRRKKK